MIHLIAQTLPSLPPNIPPGWADPEKLAALIMAIVALLGVIHNYFTKANHADVTTVAKSSDALIKINEANPKTPSVDDVHSDVTADVQKLAGPTDFVVHPIK